MEDPLNLNENIDGCLVTCYPPLFIEEELENGLRKPGMYFRTFHIVDEEKADRGRDGWMASLPQ